MDRTMEHTVVDLLHILHIIVILITHVLLIVPWILIVTLIIGTIRITEDLLHLLLIHEGMTVTLITETCITIGGIWMILTDRILLRHQGPMIILPLHPAVASMYPDECDFLNNLSVPLNAMHAKRSPFDIMLVSHSNDK